MAAAPELHRLTDRQVMLDAWQHQLIALCSSDAAVSGADGRQLSVRALAAWSHRCDLQLNAWTSESRSRFAGESAGIGMPVLRSRDRLRTRLPMRMSGTTTIGSAPA